MGSRERRATFGAKPTTPERVTDTSTDGWVVHRVPSSTGGLDDVGDRLGTEVPLLSGPVSGAAADTPPRGRVSGVRSRVARVQVIGSNAGRIVAMVTHPRRLSVDLGGDRSDCVGIRESLGSRNAVMKRPLPDPARFELGAHDGPVAIDVRPEGFGRPLQALSHANTLARQVIDVKARTWTKGVYTRAYLRYD
jgi:hypothetical protein